MSLERRFEKSVKYKMWIIVILTHKNSEWCILTGYELWKQNPRFCRPAGGRPPAGQQSADWQKIKSSKFFIFQIIHFKVAISSQIDVLVNGNISRDSLMSPSQLWWLLDPTASFIILRILHKHISIITLLDFKMSMIYDIVDGDN